MWIIDERGNAGKSWFIYYIKTQLSTRRMAPFQAGTSNNVLHQWEGQGIVFFDLHNDLQATGGVMAAMEQIKKGRYTSGKYKGGERICEDGWPQVVVMTNWPPPTRTMLEARFDTWVLVKDGVDDVHI